MEIKRKHGDGNLHMSDTTGHLLPVTQPRRRGHKGGDRHVRSERMQIEGWAGFFFQPSSQPASPEIRQISCIMQVKRPVRNSQAENYTDKDPLPVPAAAPKNSSNDSTFFARPKKPVAASRNQSVDAQTIWQNP